MIDDEIFKCKPCQDSECGHSRTICATSICDCQCDWPIIFGKPRETARRPISLGIMA